MRFMKFEIIAIIFTDHNGIKLELTSKMGIFGKINDRILNCRFSEEIKDGIKSKPGDEWKWRCNILEFIECSKSSTESL